MVAAVIRALTIASQSSTYYGTKMAYSLTIGRHFECGSQTKLVVELELALIKR